MTKVLCILIIELLENRRGYEGGCEGAEMRWGRVEDGWMGRWGADGVVVWWSEGGDGGGVGA